MKQEELDRPADTSKNTNPPPRAVSRQELLKQVVFILILLNLFSLFGVALWQKDLFQKLRENTEVFVGAIIWVLVFFGIVVGGTLKNGFVSFEELLSNRYAQLFVFLLSIVNAGFVGMLFVDPTSLDPKPAILVATPVLDHWDGVTEYAGDVVIVSIDTADPLFREPRFTRTNKPVRFSDLKLSSVYRLYFRPENPEALISDTMIRYVRFGTDSIKLTVRRKPHPVHFPLFPTHAILILPDLKDTITRGNQERQLPQGRYRYVLTADSYAPDSGSVSVPSKQSELEETFRLQPIKEYVTCVADRGLDTTILIDGTFQIREGETIIQGNLKPNEKVYLPVGHTFRIRAVAQDRSDPQKRIYAGETLPILIEQGMDHQVIVKVQETR